MPHVSTGSVWPRGQPYEPPVLDLATMPPPRPTRTGLRQADYDCARRSGVVTNMQVFAG